MGSGFNRRSIRLKGYDYSWPGWYYVTICTRDRACTLGTCTGGERQLSSIGETIDRAWAELPRHFASVDLDAYVIMPNHVHGIVILNDERRRGLINQTPTREVKRDWSWILMKNPALTLGKVVRHFKARTAKLVHDAGFLDFEWQRNYYEHIIRNDADLSRIRQYIHNNPLRWSMNEKNPERRSVISEI